MDPKIPTLSYYDTVVKNKISNAFFNIEAYNKHKRQIVTNPNFKLQYNFEVDKYVGDFNRQNFIRVTPVSNSSTAYASGGYLDYVLPTFAGVIDKFYIDLEITNKNALNILRIPSLPLTYEVKTMNGSNDLHTFNKDDQLLYCYKFINSKNKTALTNQFGINMQVGGGGLISINPLQTVNYLIPIRTLLSDINFFYATDKLGLKLRIQFNNGISSNNQDTGVANGGVADGEIFINKCDLIIHYTELTASNLDPIKSLSYWDYKLPAFFSHSQISITNGLVQGEKYNLKMTSLQEMSANFMLIFIRLENPRTLQGLDSLVDSKLTDIDIQNVNNKSVYSTYLFDHKSTNVELISRLFGKHDVLWEYMNDYANLSRIVFIPLGVHTCGVKSYIDDGIVYGCPYVFIGDHYIKFTYNGNTLAGNYNLHCLFANISYLRVSNGGLSITLTKS